MTRFKVYLRKINGNHHVYEHLETVEAGTAGFAKWWVAQQKHPYSQKDRTEYMERLEAEPIATPVPKHRHNRRIDL